ncbi:MAG: YceD family protein [Pseudomonadota bacterium]
MTIPLKISASKAIARREHYEGSLPIAGFARLEGLLAADRGEISAKLEAGVDEAGLPHLRVGLTGVLRLVCQRCMKPFDWGLQASVGLRLVKTEAEEVQALHECEPYLVQDDQLPLCDIVEDELLLALPMMPRCKSCENKPSKAPPKEPVTETRRENPFAALKTLKFEGRKKR